MSQVKGQSYIQSSQTDPPILVWDATDVVFPPKEPDALFVTTNFFQTPNQQRSTCLSSNADALPPCQKYKAITDGIETGITINNTCQIWGWCEPEVIPPDGPKNYLTGVENFTVFVRVSAKWPKWNIFRDNIDTDDLQDGYNLWTVDQLLQNAGVSLEDENIRQNGTVIAMTINWNCNFDKAKSKCKPDFDWVR